MLFQCSYPCVVLQTYVAVKSNQPQTQDHLVDGNEGELLWDAESVKPSPSPTYLKVMVNHFRLTYFSAKLQELYSLVRAMHLLSRQPLE